jgi:hypothetical protein
VAYCAITACILTSKHVIGSRAAAEPYPPADALP